MPLVFGVLLFVGVGLAFVWLAWYSVRRWEASGLVATWALSTIGLAAVGASRVRAQQTALGFTPARQAQLPTPFPLFVLLLASAFGAAAWYVARRRRAGVNLSPGTLVRGGMAYLGGALAFLLAYAALDVAGLLPGR